MSCRSSQFVAEWRRLPYPAASLYADRKILPEKGRYGSCDDVLVENSALQDTTLQWLGTGQAGNRKLTISDGGEADGADRGLMEDCWGVKSRRWMWTVGWEISRVAGGAGCVGREWTALPPGVSVCLPSRAKWG